MSLELDRVDGVPLRLANAYRRKFGLSRWSGLVRVNGLTPRRQGDDPLPPAYAWIVETQVYLGESKSLSRACRKIWRPRKQDQGLKTTFMQPSCLARNVS